MLRKEEILNSARNYGGCTGIFRGNEQLEAEGKEPATGEQGMLGITKASLQQILSCRRFLPGDDKVLTEAAIKGKVDHLVGLKENVIIGKHIPAGTGMRKYRCKISTELGEDDEIDFDEELDLNEVDVEEEQA